MLQKHELLDNAFGDVPYHALKIMIHTQNKGHCARPHFSL
jgi:hypothetical protein